MSVKRVSRGQRPLLQTYILISELIRLLFLESDLLFILNENYVIPRPLLAVTKKENLLFFLIPEIYLKVVRRTSLWLSRTGIQHSRTEQKTRKTILQYEIHKLFFNS